MLPSVIGGPGGCLGFAAIQLIGWRSKGAANFCQDTQCDGKDDVIYALVDNRT